MEILSPNPIKKFLKGSDNFIRKYSIKKQFYVNQNEDDLLKTKSQKTGLSESEFLRSCIKGYKIKEQPTDEIREFIKQITGIANNINQIARAVNSTKYIRDEDLEYIKNTIPNFIMKLEKKVYSRGDDFDGNN